jgi:hypothetical protein
MAYLRGSEWRIWDLHIHTPASFNYKGPKFREMSHADRTDSVAKIIENINKSETAVFAINDYWTFDGYLLLREAYESAKAVQKTIFPAIELRIESASAHRVNIHVIFSDKVTVQQLSDFKSHLKLRLTNRSLSDEAIREYASDLDPAKAKENGATGDYKNDLAQLYRIGCQTAEITKASFEDALQTVPKELRLVMAPYDCYGGIEPIKWKEQPAEDLYFLRMVDIVEERDEFNVDLFLCRENAENAKFIENFRVAIGGEPKPCVSGSDGHSIDGFLNWRKETAQKKTWIKSDPTFEGLRQIIYEPQARVRIRATNPNSDFTKSFFSSIRIGANIPVFTPNPNYEGPLFGATGDLPLNRDLVCIIGGRGTGKSCLIDYLGHAFTTSNRRADLAYDAAFEVLYHKNATESMSLKASEHSGLPFVYISQSEVKKKIDEGSVGVEIKRMLGIADNAFDMEVQLQISKLVEAVENIREWLEQKGPSGDPVYDAKVIAETLAANSNLLNSITTDENREKLEKFTKNVEEHHKISAKSKLIAQLAIDLQSIADTLNKRIHALDDSTIPMIDFRAQVEALTVHQRQLNTRLEELNRENETIRSDFAKFYSGDLSSLLGNAEGYRRTIDQLNDKLSRLRAKEKELTVAIESRKAIPELVSAELKRQKDEIDERWNWIRAGQPGWEETQRELMNKILTDRGLQIEGKIVFDGKKFIEKVAAVIDRRFFRAISGQTTEQRIAAEFPITNLESYCQFMRDRLHEIESAEFISGDLLGVFYNIHERAEYLFVEPQILYNGSPLNRLSVGQKGTVYLCLKLATQTFSQPLVFDQPEDDLDNEFIIQDLVDIFRAIKVFRQVILVTHNANLVVNADAEQVIVATNENGTLHYDGGSLENPTTNQAIRRILEGGDAAFKRREKRYSFDRR